MKKLTKLIILVLILSTTSFFSNTELEAEAATNKVSATTTDNLNVREKPTTNAKKLGTLKKGTKVEVHEKLSSGWSKITYNKKAAYVNTKYLNFSNGGTTAWNGKYGYYSKSTDFISFGILNITKQTTNKFHFSLEVGNENHYNGNHFNGLVEGYATFNGNTAIVNIVDDEVGVCKMKMQKTSKGIEVTEDKSREYGGCYDYRGVQVNFDGTFTKK